MSLVPSRGGLERRLVLGGFTRLLAELEEWRLDPEISSMKPEHQVHAFVRGLRLSAHLTYIVREVLSGSALQAHWGHILDLQGRYCSRECDVIIHQAGYVAKWNGNYEPVMDFRFIGSDKAVAVISCKSLLRTLDTGQAQYCQDMKKFVDIVYLFAECCFAHASETLGVRSRDAGYDGFWHLYAIDKQMELTMYDENIWLAFIDEMRRLADLFPVGGVTS